MTDELRTILTAATATTLWRLRLWQLTVRNTPWGQPRPDFSDLMADQADAHANGIADLVSDIANRYRPNAADETAAILAWGRAQPGQAEDASASTPATLGWTHDTPTESGWYWYSDRAYGPAPVYLLRRRSRTPGTIPLRVDQVAVREDMGQDLLGVLASDLPGCWRPLAERAPEDYSIEEDAPQ